VTRARNYQPDATILGVQVQEMLDTDSSVETIAGMNRDPQFGPLVLFGLGGIFVEVLEDTTVRVAPVSEPAAEEMLSEIDAAPLLRGARGRDPVDEDAIVESLQRLSRLVTDFPAIVELDINPLVATPDGVQAVDVRLTLDQEELCNPYSSRLPETAPARQPSRSRSRHSHRTRVSMSATSSRKGPD
jgi:acetyltransferase